MHEQAKIAEAEYFLSRMRGELDQPEPFRYDLSAFLSAARSALQYARKEAGTKAGGTTWYDSKMGADSTLAFFRDKRDFSIHRYPVVPQTRITVAIQDTIHLSQSVSFVLTDADGNVIQSGSTAAPQSPLPAPRSCTTCTTTYDYSFPDWPVPHRLEDLCVAYLAAIKQIVAEGVSKGFVTP
jgi:hypothetical protein